MKQIFLFISLIFAISIAHSKNVTVAGDWLMTKIVTADKTTEAYAPVNFAPNGNFIAMDMNMGTWKLSNNGKVLIINSAMFKAANGENKVVKRNKEELILKNSTATLYFIKLDKEKVAEENKNSGFIGTWKLPTDDPKTLRLLTFSTPDNFTFVETEPGVTSKARGSWIYNKKKHSLIVIMMGHNEDFRGLNKVQSVDKNGFTLENKGKILKAVKAKTSHKIEHLTFSEDDFFDADGNFKYEGDENKLPWQDVYAMIDYLKDIHQLTYSYSKLVRNTQVLKKQLLTANVTTNEDEGRGCIDFIFNGYDKKHLPEDTELPPNCTSSYNKLFPEKGEDFRVTGKEQVTTPAGTFACTVVEALGDNDQRLKMWMIDDKPGVYAKIIAENPDENFGYYHLFELQSIQ